MTKEKLKKIASMCKSSVSLEYRELSNVYEKLSDRVSYADEGSTYMHTSNFLDGELDKCIKTDEYWNLHFYPETPVGFYSAYSNDLDKLLDWALDILNKIQKERELNK